MTAPAREIAPAKLNLALHVRGKRADGRHDIETVFAFCTDGDRLSAVPAEEVSLSVTGPFGADIGEDNLVLTAVRALDAWQDVPVLERDLRERAAGVLAGEFPVAAIPHRALCATCPGRATLCSHPPERTDRPVEEAIGAQ